MKQETKNFVDKIIPGLVNTIVTVVLTMGTIASTGWKIHKEIVSEVSSIQQQSEEKYMLLLNNKLEKEPAGYLIDAQNSRLDTIQNDIKLANEKIIGLELKMKELTSLLRGHGGGSAAREIYEDNKKL